MKLKRSITCLALASLAIVANLLPTPRAHAYTQADLNNINSRISALRSQMNAYEEQASALAREANSIQAEINSLRAQQDALRTQIELKEAEHEQIVIEIETITKRINDNYETVGYTIAQLRYNNDVTTLERIASSQSFSSFIDEEVRLSGISKKNLKSKRRMLSLF